MKFGRQGTARATSVAPLPTGPGSLPGTRHPDFRFLWGAPIFAERSFVGVLYPPKTPAHRFLEAYGRQFNALELNSTFYSTPSAEQIERWCGVVPASFRFCPKVHQSLSHAGATAAGVHAFVERMQGFGEKLGAAFLQMPPSFAPDQRRRLFELLQSFPDGFPLALELRHRGWFAPEQLERLTQYLHQRGFFWVMTDTLGAPEVLHTALASRRAMVRFTGDSLAPTDLPRLDAWLERILFWREKGLEEAYFFLHQPQEVDCAALAEHAAPQLQTAGLTVPEFRRYDRIQLGLLDRES